MNDNNQLITINQNAKLSLIKSRNFLDITRKILDKKDDDWIQRLWEWADENNVSQNIIPRVENDLINLEEINLSSDLSYSTCEVSLGLAGNFKNEYTYRTKIQSIPKELFNLKKIKKFDCSNNNLISIPKEISKFQNLISLNISHNNINELPDSIGELTNLEELNLSSNELIILPDKIIQLSNIKYLFIKNKNLSLTQNQEKWLNNLTQHGGIIFK